MESNLITNTPSHNACNYEDGVCSLAERIDKNWHNSKTRKDLTSDIIEKIRKVSSSNITVKQITC